jgi:hypothetical protein
MYSKQLGNNKLGDRVLHRKLREVTLVKLIRLQAAFGKLNCQEPFGLV